MRKNIEGEIRVRCAEAERGFLAGVKEMVKMRAEKGVLPWGKHVFYPRMLHKRERDGGAFLGSRQTGREIIMIPGNG